MKTILLFAGLFFCLICKAQRFYEYQDTRKKNESFKKIPPGNIRNDLSTFTLSGIDEAVGKEEPGKISYKTFGSDFMTFEGDGVNAKITLAPFNPAKHKLDYDEKYLIRIDRKPYYGGYSVIPKTYISNIVITIDNDTVAIPAIAYADLYNLNLTYTDKGSLKTRNGIYKSKDGHWVYLYIFCKDATGSYEVTWVIQDKKYVRRVLDYGFL